MEGKNERPHHRCKISRVSSEREVLATQTASNHGDDTPLMELEKEA